MDYILVERQRGSNGHKEYLFFDKCGYQRGSFDNVGIIKDAEGRAIGDMCIDFPYMRLPTLLNMVGSVMLQDGSFEPLGPVDFLMTQPPIADGKHDLEYFIKNHGWEHKVILPKEI